MRAQHRVWAGWGIVGLSGLGVVAACTAPNTLTSNGGIIGPGTTSVSVDPQEFLGSVTCSNMPGSMQSYVATITDQSLPGAGPNAIPGFVLPSSPPTHCSQSVYFEYVIIGDAFSAEVDGYDEPLENLAPACSFSGLVAPPGRASCTTDNECTPIFGCGGACIVNPGDPKNPEPLRSGPCAAAQDAGTTVTCLCNYAAANGGRQMYYPLSYPDHDGKKHNTQVTPLWTISSDRPCGIVDPPPKAHCNCPPGTVCGLDAECYIQSQAFTDVSISPCYGLNGQTQPTDGGPAASIQVVPAAALGSLACAADAGIGTVTAFDVNPVAEPALTPVLGLACLDPQATAGVVFSQGLTVGRSYTFTLNAYVATSTSPAYTSQCFATAQQGMVVTAMCDPLALPLDGG